MSQRGVWVFLQMGRSAPGKTHTSCSTLIITATGPLLFLYRHFWPQSRAFFSMTHYGSTWSKRGSAHPPEFGSGTTSFMLTQLLQFGENGRFMQLWKFLGDRPAHPDTPASINSSVFVDHVTYDYLEQFIGCRLIGPHYVSWAL